MDQSPVSKKEKKKEKKTHTHILTEIVFYLEFIYRKEVNEQKNKGINVFHSL